jgi:aromatase
MTEYRAEHSIFTRADPAVVYDLIADVALWPVLFEPTVHVDVLERQYQPDGTTVERFRIHALVGGAVRAWNSQRWLDPTALVIDFEQEHSSPPLKTMGGRWQFHAVDGGTTVLLTHRFTLTDPDPESLQWTIEVLDTNSDRELAAVQRATSGQFSVRDLTVKCEDVVTAPPGVAVYEFIEHAEHWPDLLPHVEHVHLQQIDKQVQDLTMTTRAPGGAAHRTRSIRLCDPPFRIVYKQLERPAGLMGHSGAWQFDSASPAGDLTVTSRHTALIAPDVPTETADLDEIRQQIAQALSTNSRATLSYAAASSRPEVSHLKVANGAFATINGGVGHQLERR